MAEQSHMQQYHGNTDPKNTNWEEERKKNTQNSSSSVFPAISLGFTISGEIFAYVTVF